MKNLRSTKGSILRTVLVESKMENWKLKSGKSGFFWKLKEL